LDSVSTNNVFEAVKGEIERRIDGIDSCTIFDGTLQDALDQHFASRPSGSRFVFIGLADASNESNSGYGVPVRETLLVDIYVVVRASGATRYTSDREAFWDISDAIVHDLFEFSGRSSDAKSSFGGTNYLGRFRQPAGSDVMSHLIRWGIIPQRQVTSP
jgi:hypothetical protein